MLSEIWACLRADSEKPQTHALTHPLGWYWRLTRHLISCLPLLSSSTFDSDINVIENGTGFLEVATLRPGYFFFVSVSSTEPANSCPFRSNGILDEKLFEDGEMAILLHYISPRPGQQFDQDFMTCASPIDTWGWPPSFESHRWRS